MTRAQGVIAAKVCRCYYQCVAGERYIANRYGNPVNAWAHERDYGWY